MIPSSIRVIGKDYKVTQEHLQGSIGECDDFKQEINVDPKANEQLQRDTLLHEVIHAIDYAVKTKLSEEQVSALATGLYAVFSDNPNFMEWLNERPTKRPKSRNPKSAKKS